MGLNDIDLNSIVWEHWLDSRGKRHRASVMDSGEDGWNRTLICIEAGTGIGSDNLAKTARLEFLSGVGTYELDERCCVYEPNVTIRIPAGSRFRLTRADTQTLVILCSPPPPRVA